MRQTLCARMTGIALLIVLLLSGTAMGALPDILGHVPADAEIAIIVPNLAALQSKLPAIEPGQQQTSAISGLATHAALGGARGVRLDGGMLVLTRGHGFTGTPAQSLVLVPINDFDALLATFDNVGDSGGGVRSATGYGGAIQQVYLRELGDHAVISSDPGWARSFQTGGSARARAIGDELGAGARTTLEQGDLAIYLNLPALHRTVGQQLPALSQMMSDQARQQVQLGLADRNEAMMQTVFQDSMLDTVAAVLRDGRGALIGLTLGVDQIDLTFDLQLDPDSSLGGQLTTAPDRPLLLNRLPAYPYLMAMSTDLSSLPIQAWMQNLRQRLPADNPYAAMLDHVSTLAPHRGSAAQEAWYLPSDQTRGVMANLVVAESPDATAFIDTFAQAAETPRNNGLELVYGKRVMTSGPMQEDRIDFLKAGIDLPASGLAHYGQLAMMLTHGYNGYVTPTAAGLAICSEPSQALIDSAIAHADGSGTMDQNPGIAQLRASMPPNRVVEAYVNFASAFDFLRLMLVRVDHRVAQIDVPADLPPTAISVSINNSNVLAKIQAPRQLLHAMAFAMLQLKALESDVVVDVQ